MIGATVLPVSESLREGIEREWQRLAAPGTLFSGQARVAMAGRARITRAGEAPAAPGTRVDELVETVAREPWIIDQEFLDLLEDNGMSRPEVAEVVGVVSRLVAVDTFTSGVGGDVLPLPEPLPGEPTGALEPRAKPANAWLPTVGGARAATVLSSVPAEMYAQEDLHGVLYLRYEDIGEFDVVVDGLSRTQMEVVAARTSYLNHCVF